LAAGAIAEKFMREQYNVEIIVFISSVGGISAKNVDTVSLARGIIDTTPIRYPDPQAASLMIDLVKSVKDDNDSVGGTITCIVKGIPAGWGDPVFDKIEARLAQAMLSLPATKGFEIGSGFAETALRGSVHNDLYSA
jgi:chorismate synthase